jgi:uncharacterized membrane protein
MPKKKNEVHNLLLHTFELKDILQVIIGATILAIPVGFTEETWRLGENLPWLNIIGLFLLSILFIAAFVYYNYHKVHEFNGGEFVKRVVSTYAFSFIVVAVILTLIQRTPWSTDFALALKRVIIVTLPSTMSAAVADVLR